MPPDLDWELRLAAFARLEQLKRVRGGIVTDKALDAGFEFREKTIKFWSSRPEHMWPKLSPASAGTR